MVSQRAMPNLTFGSMKLILAPPRHWGRPVFNSLPKCPFLNIFPLALEGSLGSADLPHGSLSSEGTSGATGERFGWPRAVPCYANTFQPCGTHLGTEQEWGSPKPHIGYETPWTGCQTKASQGRGAGSSPDELNVASCRLGPCGCHGHCCL